MGVRLAPGVLVRFARNEAGTTAIEYALLSILVSVAIIAGVSAVGTTLKTQFYETFPKALAGNTPAPDAP